MADPIKEVMLACVYPADAGQHRSSREWLRTFQNKVLKRALVLIQQGHCPIEAVGAAHNKSLSAKRPGGEPREAWRKRGGRLRHKGQGPAKRCSILEGWMLK